MSEMKKTSMDLIFQVCVCVYDMDETLENWKKLFDIDESSIKIKYTEDYLKNDDWNGLNYNEKPCEWFNKFCRFDLGGVDFDIIEPLQKEPGNPYSDFLHEHGQGIHHIGVKLGDLNLFKENMKELGYPRMNYAEMGPVLSDGSRKGCFFYDLRDRLGCILECCSMVVGPLADDPRSGNPKDFVNN